MKINGKAIADSIYSDLEKRVTKLKSKGVTPHLLIILIGNDAASKAYINQKVKNAKRIGIKTTFKRFPKRVAEKSLLDFIQTANDDTAIHGIIIQRPVPPQINAEQLNTAVIPEKDVDGFHPESKFDPPLAKAVIAILYKVYSTQDTTPSESSSIIRPSNLFKIWLTSKNIVMLGRGEAGGKPIISHIEKMNVPHKIIHSKTENPKDIIKHADIIISAVGKMRVIKKSDLKKGVILIGIGLHKENDTQLRGDYDEDDIKETALWYTPTPRGVGPVNVAMLLENTALSAAMSSEVK